MNGRKLNPTDNQNYFMFISSLDWMWDFSWVESVKMEKVKQSLNEKYIVIFAKQNKVPMILVHLPVYW